MLGAFGWQEMVVVGVIALLIFGKRLPEVMRSLGKGVVEFKKGVRGIEDDVDKSSAEEPKQVETKAPDKEIKG